MVVSVSRRGRILVGLLVLAAVGAVAALVGYRLHARSTVATVSPPAGGAPASRPAATTRPATAAATPLREIATYMDVVRAEYPALPTTQPLAMPLDVSQAGRIVLKDPVYLSGPQRADLWITRPDAPPTAQVLRAATSLSDDVQSHVVRERVAYVHWMPAETGPWPPYLICRTPGGGHELVTANQRRPLPTKRD